MSDDGWEFWGDVYDRQATLATIRVLQADNQQVRVVRAGNKNALYVKPRVS